MSAERRIDPDFVEPIDRADLVLLIQRSIREMRPEVSYSEFPSALVKWVAGGIMALAVSGIIGLVVLYGEIQSFRAELTALRSEINDVKRLIEPRYRGGPDDANAR